MLVIFASVGRLGALLSDDFELLGRKHSLPLVVALLDWIVRHISFLLRTEETSQEWEGGHRPVEVSYCGGCRYSSVWTWEAS